MKNRLPGFSVIIPVYNGEYHIKAAINSCLQQTMKPDEIIVIDDASRDDTQLVVNNIDSSHIKYIRIRENRGPSFCRNLGIKLAKFNWILFLDADDIFHHNKIEIINYFLHSNSQIKAIGHAFSIGSKSQQFPGNWKQTVHPQLLTVAHVLMRNPVVTPALAVSADNQVFFNEKMKFAEDHDFILRLAESVGIWFIDVSLCSLGRQPLSSGGLSANRWKMRKGEIRMYMNYCLRQRKYVYMPFMFVFSLTKYIKSLIFKR